MTTGKDLRLARVAADIGVAEVARGMGVTRQTIWAIERAASVRPEQAESYRAAIARLQAERAA